MALTFCGAVYFRDRRLWLVPFAALLLSDLYIDWHYATHLGYTWGAGDAVIRLARRAVAREAALRTSGRWATRSRVS